MSKAGFWAWITRVPSDRALTDEWVKQRIKEIHARSRGTYGSPNDWGNAGETFSTVET